ncbi:MAG: nucleoside deaminase [Clostridia bacterium]|nr:nucleoside deaminase [Clostridia bacterium]
MNYMKLALGEAQKAYDENEVPIGAVIVKDGIVIASSHNKCEKEKDCTCHAEMNAIKAAMKMTGEKVLDSCEMYVTVEPCAMCAGAIANARIRRVYIGCEEPKTGCMGSVTNLANMLPHKCEVYYGFCEDECKSIMKKFFESKRKITD